MDILKTLIVTYSHTTNQKQTKSNFLPSTIKINNKKTILKRGKRHDKKNNCNNLYDGLR